MGVHNHCEGIAMGERDLNIDHLGIDLGQTDRMGRPVLPKGPGQKKAVPGWAWFIGGIVATIVGLMALLVLISLSNSMSPRQDPANVHPLDRMNGPVEIARIFEAYLKTVSPACGTYMDTADVSELRGFLIVRMLPGYAGLNPEDRGMIEANIASLWREAKWVKDRGWRPQVEILVPGAEGYSSHFVP